MSETYIQTEEQVYMARKAELHVQEEQKRAELEREKDVHAYLINQAASTKHDLEQHESRYKLEIQDMQIQLDTLNAAIEANGPRVDQIEADHQALVDEIHGIELQVQDKHDTDVAAGIAKRDAERKAREAERAAQLAKDQKLKALKAPQKAPDTPKKAKPSKVSKKPVEPEPAPEEPVAEETLTEDPAPVDDQADDQPAEE
jgi:chromosome segregation ATPase